MWFYNKMIRTFSDTTLLQRAEVSEAKALTLVVETEKLRQENIELQFKVESG